MGRLIMFNLVSLDGFFADRDGGIEWFRTDDESEEFSVEQMQTAAALVFGRVTFELMASYWPSDDALRDEPVIAEKMNSLPKTVFSRTLDTVDWSNSEVVKGDAVEEVVRLKRRVDGNIFLFGSADLAVALTAAGLFEEYRLLVNPVVLGSGKPLFKGGQRLDLDLTGARAFAGGNVLLTYTPQGR